MDSCNFLFDVEKGKFHFSRSCFNRRRRRWWRRRWGVVHARLFWTGTSFTTLHDTGLCHWRTTAPWWILITQKERERETLQDTAGGLEKKKKLRVTFFLFSQDIYILRSTIAALACVEKQHISCVILAVVVFLLLLTTIFHRDQQFFVFLFMTSLDESVDLYASVIDTGPTLPFPPYVDASSACRPFWLIRFCSHEARISNQFLWIVVVFCCLSLIELLVIDRISS